MEELLRDVEAMLWGERVEELPRPVRYILYTVRFIYALIRDVVTTTLTLRAMGLVYITILSIVPMLALVFASLKGFGIHRSSIQPALLQVLEPLGQKGVELTDQLIGIVDNVEGGLLAGVGLLLLIYTTVSMIHKIEESLNHIWRVEASRNLAQRFGEYISVVLVGPVLMFTAMALIAAIGSNALVDQILSVGVFSATAVVIGKLMPYLLVSFVFGLMYWFMPNTKVQLKYAMLGGLIGGMLWAFSGVLFASFVVDSTRNASIYASFAIVIIALMWLYVSWLILLTGAQAAFYLQHPEYTRIGYRDLRIGNLVREQAAVSMMLMVAEAYRDSARNCSTNDVGARLGIPGILLGPVRERLMVAGLLELGSKDQLLPARDPAMISLADVISAVRVPNNDDLYRGGAWPAPVEQLFGELNADTAAKLQHQTVYGLLDSKS